MKLLVFLLLISGLAQANDLESLRVKAAALFTREIGKTDGKIAIELNSRECLRTGYSRALKKVVFCQTDHVINGGLESDDVINHEFFHALFCGKYPGLCVTDEFDYIHEALADVFAYRLNPDKHFGENFYSDHSFIRPYETDWLPELVQSSHEQGSALAARLIREGKPLSEAFVLFGEELKTYASVDVEGAPASRLNRYRVDPGQEVKFDFHFDKKSGVKSLAWDLPSGMEAGTSIRVTEAFTGGKGRVRFLSADKKELGRWTFYFGRKL